MQYYFERLVATSQYRHTHAAPEMTDQLVNKMLGHSHSHSKTEG